MMDERRFALQIKLHSKIRKRNVNAIESCAMFLREQLKGKGKIVQGYCSTVTGEKFKHYWVEDDSGKRFDIAMEMAKLAAPDLIAVLAYTLTIEKPEGNVTFDEHNDELFKLYLEEPVKFWRSVERIRR